MVKYKTISQFCQESGYTRKAVERKRERGEWGEGIIVKAPDGHILINIEGFNAWVINSKKQDLKELPKSATLQYKSTSGIPIKTTGLRSSVIPMTKRY